MSVGPDVTIVVDDTALARGQVSNVVFTFSQPVFDFTLSDITAGNGVVSNLSMLDATTWAAELTPTDQVTDASNVVSLDLQGVEDIDGNAGFYIAESNNYAVDTAQPTATITLADTALKIGETSLVTFTFSEAVSDFTNADLNVNGGLLSTVGSSDGGLTYTATFTPAALFTDATNVITLTNTAVTDGAGNPGVGTTGSGNYAIDTAAPSTVGIVFTDTALKIEETSLVTFTFNEAVNNFTNADLTIVNGSLTAVGSSNGGLTYTATFTPTAATTDASNVITLTNTTLTDLAGNPGVGTTGSSNYAIDTAGPTATILLADTMLNIGETSAVTITFSEAVTGFANIDLTVVNGVLSTVATANNIVYTAIFTPTAGLTDTTNVITLANAGVLDAAGNAGAGTSTSANFAIDTAPPPEPEPEPPAPVELPGSTASEAIVGNDMSNLIIAGAGNDTASGGVGADSLQGDAGDDVVQGNTGNDDLAGGVGNDVVLGGQDNDAVQGNTENDYVSGDRGSDTVHGGRGDDIAYGGEGNDVVFGDRDNDIVRGGAGADQVFGGDGDDYVSGDRGSDTITGGAGADLFHTFGEAGLDLVTDFSLGQGDRVILDLGTTYIVSQVGFDTVIDMTGGGQMILSNVQLSTLTPGWIIVA